MCACVCPIPSISQEWLDSATFCHYVIIALAFLWLSSCIFSLTKSSKKDTHRHSKNPAILSQVSLGWEYPIGLWDSDPWCSCSWLPYDLASTQSADLAQWMAEHSKGVFFFPENSNLAPTWNPFKQWYRDREYHDPYWFMTSHDVCILRAAIR